MVQIIRPGRPMGGVGKAPASALVFEASAFDGSTDYTWRNADPTGLINGKVGTFACWFKPTNFDAAQIIMSNFTPRTEVRITTGGLVEITAKASTNIEKLKLSSSSTLSVGVWNHIFASWNLAAGGGSGVLDINGVDDKTENTYVNEDLDYTRTFWAIGGTTPAVESSPADTIVGCLAELYFHSTVQHTDVTLFRTAGGRPVETVPTAGIIYYKTFHGGATNQGSGGDFVDQGSLVACADGP